MTYRMIDGQHDIRAWPMWGRNSRWCATISDVASKCIIATGSGMSCDAAIADASGKLLPSPEEITRDMPGWRFWAALAAGIGVIGWCGYAVLTHIMN